MAKSKRRNFRPASNKTAWSGLNANTKTYQTYMRERRRIQSIANRLKRSKGIDIDLSELILNTIGIDAPSTYGEMKRVTSLFKKIHSGKELARLYNESVPTWADIVIGNFNMMFDIEEDFNIGKDEVSDYFLTQFGAETPISFFHRFIDQAVTTYGKDAVALAYTELTDEGAKFFYYFDHYGEAVDIGVMHHFIDVLTHGTGDSMLEDALSMYNEEQDLLIQSKMEENRRYGYAHPRGSRRKKA